MIAEVWRAGQRWRVEIFIFQTTLSSNIANHSVYLGLSQSCILRNPLVTGKPRTVGHLTSAEVAQKIIFLRQLF